jgi:hypothetical protein
MKKKPRVVEDWGLVCFYLGRALEQGAFKGKGNDIWFHHEDPKEYSPYLMGFEAYVVGMAVWE